VKRMFSSLAQIATSAQRLRDVHPFFGYAFLGFKKARLPVGVTAEFSYKYIKDEILETYFRVRGQPGYFNPFKTTSRWVSERYESTSLQRVIADSFGDAFIHDKGSSFWGWKRDYVKVLIEKMFETGTAPIPLLDISVWLYRNETLPAHDAAEYLYQKFRHEFDIDSDELHLFDTFFEGRTIELFPEPALDAELLNQIGWPEGSSERSGVSLVKLGLINIGPSREMEYQPKQRANLITGDNSLGKTFLLDCVWWAVTGTWMGYPADPLVDRRASRSEIEYTLSSGTGREEKFVAPFNVLEREWQRPLQPLQGLAVYTNFSGAFAVWDPVRNDLADQRSVRSEPYVYFRRDEIWDGLIVKSNQGKSTHVSNGLIRDWVTWQRGDHQGTLLAFESALKELSPPDGVQLRAGRPVSLANDSREIPTVRMPYGDVPVLYASAGIQRILSLAYMLVWSWFRHVEMARMSKREPLRRMVVLIDEIESHLHPRWQRQIVPALLKALEGLEPGLSVQLHISTHSPLVLASTEPSFDLDCDRIHHLSLDNDVVCLGVLENWKHGSANNWLESEAFGLKEARSKPSERLLEEATKMLLQKRPTASDVKSVHRRLVRLLPDDDPFWVRWSYFYEKFGSKKK
jgi:hypothetical protein